MKDVEKFVLVFHEVLTRKEANLRALIGGLECSDEATEVCLDLLSTIYGDMHNALNATERMVRESVIKINTATPGGLQ